jgi:hypothetical protein
MPLASIISDLFTPPEGPNLPFGNSALIILDTIRLLVISLGGTFLLFVPAAIIRTHRSGGQSLRIGATALFILGAIGTEYDHIGDYAHWRLVVNIFATVGATYGMWSLFNWELPAKVQRRGRNVSDT